jgi:hypothetical protein
VPTLAVDAAVETLGAVKKPHFWAMEETSTFARRGMVGDGSGDGGWGLTET